MWAVSKLFSLKYKMFLRWVRLCWSSKIPIFSSFENQNQISSPHKKLVTRWHSHSMSGNNSNYTKNCFSLISLIHTFSELQISHYSPWPSQHFGRAVDVSSKRFEALFKAVSWNQNQNNHPINGQSEKRDYHKEPMRDQSENE